MKNLDIENLERKNIYKTPEGFLDELQGNVLREIRPFSIDIENLERKNIYKTPEGFMDGMQQNVLSKIGPRIGERSSKKSGFNWVYAAAAAVTLFFGISYFVSNSNGSVENPVYTNDTASVTAQTTAETPAVTETKAGNEAETAYITLKQDIQSVPAEKPKAVTKPMTVSSAGNATFAAKKSTVAEQNPEIQVDQILADFSSSELATVGRNAEQDLYLDLYN